MYTKSVLLWGSALLLAAQQSLGLVLPGAQDSNLLAREAEPLDLSWAAELSPLDRRAAALAALLPRSPKGGSAGFPSRSAKQDHDKATQAAKSGINPKPAKIPAAPAPSRDQKQDMDKLNMAGKAGNNPPDTTFNWQKSAHNFQMNNPKGGGQPAVDRAENVAKEGMKDPRNPLTGGDPSAVNAKLRAAPHPTSSSEKPGQNVATHAESKPGSGQTTVQHYPEDPAHPGHFDAANYSFKEGMGQFTNPNAPGKPNPKTGKQNKGNVVPESPPLGPSYNPFARKRSLQRRVAARPSREDVLAALLQRRYTPAY